MTFAILIPCYNSAAYLPGLFEGIASQTMPFDEIICYDDFSDDNTLEIATKLGAKVIRGTANHGAAYARNRLIAATTCDWVHFHDSDDLISPMFLETMQKFIQNDSVQLLCNTHVYTFDNGTKKHVGDIDYSQLKYANDQTVYFLNNIGFASMGLYSKTALTTIGGFNELLRGNEDPDLHIRLSAACFKIINVPYFLVEKIEHAQSFSHQNWFKCMQDKLTCLITYKHALAQKYNKIIGEQAAILSNYFYREHHKILSKQARALAYDMKAGKIHTSGFAASFSLLFGLKFYLWTYRRRVDLKQVLMKIK